MNNKPIDIITAVKQAMLEHRNEQEHFSIPVVESIARRVVQLLEDSEKNNKTVLLD
jgi:hypothetical protein